MQSLLLITVTPSGHRKNHKNVVQNDCSEPKGYTTLRLARYIFAFKSSALPRKCVHTVKINHLRSSKIFIRLVLALLYLAYIYLHLLLQRFLKSCEA